VRNEDVAEVLERVAALLQAQHADAYRVRAYQHAAATCRTLAQPLDQVETLDSLPTIGKSIGASIREYLCTGRLGLLDRLEGQVSPEDLFTTLPGVGDALAHRIHDELHVETLEELEQAAHDGRLEQVAGIGARRAQALRAELESVLSRSVRRRARLLRQREQAEQPPIRDLLDVDAEYRRRASAGELHLITPRRFNPDKEAWLPVLHTRRDAWTYHALFSNTARAHRLQMTRDWVVIIFERDGDEGQCTVVTEHAGPLEGRRVVRGRERECGETFA